MATMTQGLTWKLQRVAAGMRQFDIAVKVGITTTRYSAIERGEQEPTKLEIELIERFLPPLPIVAAREERTRTFCGGGEL